MISITRYEEKYQPAFKKLNLEWLDKYGLTEPYDIEILEDPQGTILDKGGHLFIAVDGESAVGTAGLARINGSEYELVKMSVDPAYRGLGIGKQLLQQCVDVAKGLGAEKISLFSNSQLQSALDLYKQFGFYHVEVIDSPMLTADVKMELSLNNNLS
ncbi:MAG TPA: GNAT family N-acetyltransferase [Ferruginibacter sp.]|nr:GNAT family N-acetyltransferase [Ferruginibacter sp.]